MNQRNPLPLIAVLTALLFPLLLTAQNGNPRHPGVARFENIGNNTASGIVPLSDLNGDTIADFALIMGGDVWVYFGVKGGLPEPTSGFKLGPTETNATTRVRAVGDWDGMNGPDICVYWVLNGDTSFGNTEGVYPGTAWVTVFWNQGDGTFTLADTSRLFPGLYAGFVSGNGIAADLDNDGIEDLYVTSVNDALHGGQLVRIPRGHIFRGHKGERWGRGEIPNIPDWQWWNAPTTPRLDAQDLDKDSAIDVILYSSDHSTIRPLTVLYGRQDGALPDTLEDLQQVDMVSVGGWVTNFSDVSGDGIADLTVLNPSESLVYIYIGCKGQRLLEQFGTGNDPPEGERWWGKPWAAVKGPSHVNSAWFGLERLMFDFGSADTNATEEIWIVSQPYLLCYDVGGKIIEGVRYGLDSLFDGQAQIQPVPWDGVLLGDIDGDSRREFAITNFDGVHIYRTVAQLPTPTPTWWRVPNGCEGISGVNEEHGETDRRTLALRAMPNPASGDVRIRWEKNARRNERAILRITDMIGQEVVTMTIPTDQEEAVWNAAATFGGTYFVTLTIGEQTETVRVTITR